MAGLKVWGARLFTAVTIVTLVCQGLYVINPMTHDAAVVDGYCHITLLTWVLTQCNRTTPNTLYSSPSLSGRFWRHMDPASMDFVRLFVNNNQLSLPTQGFLVDDLTNKSLLDCSKASFISTKQKLVNYLPVFKDVLDVESLTENLPKLYPNKFIDCSYLNSTHVYLNYKRVSKFLMIPFLLNFILIGLGLVYIIDHDDDGPIKAFSTMIVMPLYLVAFLIHVVLYVIFIAIIGWSIFNIEPSLNLEESFNKGSILIIFRWIRDKIKRCIKPSDSSSS
ncbi:uncharacterized protein LOC134811749 [Bolinopsis microptera]|uniref:uncharacterized protein LOC134811749 n=1 Tax=Bolinopsis microptera TaxID=2820187 RepID=UPI003078AFCB